MGNQQSIRKIGYEDVQYIIQHKKKNHFLINTLSANEQSCLIPDTTNIHDEVSLLNKHINKNIYIIVYGKNANDETIFKKYEQLLGLGFTSVFVYTGGLFEWLLLQDVYGIEEFPTDGDEMDILKYKPNTVLQNQFLLENG